MPPRYNIPNEFDFRAIIGPDGYIVPKTENSGRIANIPVCSLEATISESENDLKENVAKRSEKPKNTLAACTWASTTFLTRNNGASVNDGERRLLEW